MADNVVHYGGALDAASSEQNIRGVSFLTMMAQEQRVGAIAIQTRECKGSRRISAGGGAEVVDPTVNLLRVKVCS